MTRSFSWATHTNASLLLAHMTFAVADIIRVSWWEFVLPFHPDWVVLTNRMVFWHLAAAVILSILMGWMNWFMRACDFDRWIARILCLIVGTTAIVGSWFTLRLVIWHFGMNSTVG